MIVIGEFQQLAAGDDDTTPAAARVLVDSS